MAHLRNSSIGEATDEHPRDYWRKRNARYHGAIQSLVQSFIQETDVVLEVGCSTGGLLGALRCAERVGLDIDGQAVDAARSHYPEIRFLEGDILSYEFSEQFDVVILSDVVGLLDDLWGVFRSLHQVVRPNGRLIITHYNQLWEPLIVLAEYLEWKQPEAMPHWLPRREIVNLLDLCHWRVRAEGGMMPRPLGSTNQAGYVSTQGGVLSLVGLVQFVVAEPVSPPSTTKLSCSIIVPCRNEAGNIREIFDRTPEIGSSTELIFVDGASTDGTPQLIEELATSHPWPWTVRLIHQIPPDGPVATERPSRMLRLGKGDAVRKGFAASQGEVLMILDADLTVPPEDLPRFYLLLVEGKGVLANGSRLIYQPEQSAMRPINIIGNRLFSLGFSWLFGYPIRDTLCGTKALMAKDYAVISANRAYFGDFDPFGDFDLLFGVARLGLKIRDLPVRYRTRRAGVSKVGVVRHGWLLVTMFFFGLYRLKIYPLLRRFLVGKDG